MSGVRAEQRSKGKKALRKATKRLERRGDRPCAARGVIVTLVGEIATSSVIIYCDLDSVTHPGLILRLRMRRQEGISAS